MSVQNDILRALDRRQGVYLVLLDLSAAFDTIDHHILLDGLRSRIGVEGHALRWIESYLTGRQQRVVIRGSPSEPVDLLFGVPQGSVLGPKFFIVYTAPIADICRRHDVSVHMYADDTQVFLSFDLYDRTQETAALRRVEACISEIRFWMIKNKLKLNDEKTEFLIVSSKQQQKRISTSNIMIGDCSVQAVDSARNLGAVFDRALDMDTHITALCQAAYYQLRNIRSIRNVLSRPITEILVHTFVTSRLDNGNSLLAGIANKSLQKLQQVQNSAARLILGLRKFDHITPALIELHWLPVKERILFKTLLLTWKAQHAQAPGYMQDMLCPFSSNRHLRSSDRQLLRVPKTNLKTYGDRAFSVVAPKAWNNLPETIKLSPSKDVFKSRLKAHLFQSAFESP